MRTLRDLQRRCYDAFVLDAGHRLTPFLAGTAPNAAVAVYRNNALEIARKALAAGFPVIQRLCGEPCFRTLARDYLVQHPSSDGNLDRFGAEFPGFLDAQFGGGAFDYFSYVARLEWACEEAWIAPQAPAADLTSLARVPAERIGELRLGVQPSCRIVSAPYPVVSIWKVNSTGEDHTLSLDAGGETALVARHGTGLDVHAVAPADAAFIGALQAGEALAAACDAAVIADPAFEPAGVLRMLASAGLLAAVTIP